MKPQRGAWLILTLGILLIASTALIGCARDTSAPTLVPTAEDAMTSPSPQQTVDAPIAVEMDVDVPFEDVECLDCHTDQVLLTELAEPPEVVEDHSEGPG
jgi:curli biogenesis system outer membrane secretion channel CsgG